MGGNGVEMHASVSIFSAVVSFFVTVQPILSGLAALMAICSGAVAVTWGLIKIRDRLRSKQVQEED